MRTKPGNGNATPRPRSSRSSRNPRLAEGTGDIVGEYGISEKTLYNWKRMCGGLEASDLRQLKNLEEENRRLKQIVADLTLDNQALTRRENGLYGSNEAALVRP